MFGVISKPFATLPYREDVPLLYKKDVLLLHRKNKPPLYKEGLVKVDVDIPKVRSDHVQPAVFLTILLIASSVVFFIERLLLYYYRTEKALIRK